MEKVLNQEEIDAMVRQARGGAAPAQPVTQANVEPWDVRCAGQMGKEELQAITLIHETFARNLTHSLGAYLRVVFATTLVSAEHLTFREFLQGLPETTYLASCRLDPMGACAALQLDLSVAFPMVDLLLGGEGKVVEQSREITEIEEQILDSVAGILCRELAAAWQALPLEIGFEVRLESAAAQRLMPPEEKMLALSFEVIMPDARGGLNVAFPATVSNALLRTLSNNWTQHRARGSTDSRQRLMRLLLDCPFDLELAATNLCLPVSTIAELGPDRVLDFARPATEPASLLVAGVESFRAVPARCGAVRAAKLCAVVSTTHSRIGNAKEKFQ